MLITIVILVWVIIALLYAAVLSSEGWYAKNIHWWSYIVLLPLEIIAAPFFIWHKYFREVRSCLRFHFLLIFSLFSIIRIKVICNIAMPVSLSRS